MQITTLSFRRILPLLLFCLAAGSVWSQPLPYDASRREALRRLRQSFENEQSARLRRVEAVARRLRLPLREVRPDGTVILLQHLDERGNPVFDATHSATRAGQATRTSTLYAGGGLGVALTGASPALRNKLGIWDGGRVLSTHTEFGGRVTQLDNPPGSDTHASHVAGILIGAGHNPLARGMAFGASLQAWDFANDDAEIAAAAADLLVSNHSYGTVAGWQFNAARSGDIKWEWYGDTTVSATEDIKFGLYNTRARDWDRIAYNAPYYLMVNSAGNNQGRNGPGEGQPHYLGSRGTVSRETRKPQTGYDQITTYATAKNILTVGATAPLSEGYVKPADITLASFSAWGPTDDGRIKPDLVGVGVGVLSVSAVGNAGYTSLNGTSMSSPNVAGSLFLLQDFFSQLNGGRFMRSATLKGLAIHTANETGPAPGPDYRSGWGLLNTERAARVIANSDRSHLVEERSLNQNEPYSLTLVASGRGPLVVTLCWTDPEGEATASNPEGLNNPTPKLVNDLDIRLSDGTNTLLPWTLDPANPDRPATRGDNIRDNVEQIRIDNPIPGRTYTLTVTNKGPLRNSRQDYSLLISGMGGTAYCASAAASPERTKIDRVRFGSIDQAGADGCRTETDFTAIGAELTSGQTVPLEVNVGSCGVARPAFVRAFIDWNSDGDFDDAGEAVAASESLTAPATFRAEVRVPGGLSGQQATRMRIIASEVNEARTIMPCGPYANGETQDFVLRFATPTSDVGVLALLNPDNGFCSRSETRITVRLRNYGTTAQQNIPVQARILKPDGTLLSSLNGMLESLGANSDGQLTLQGTTTLESGQNYRIVVQTALANDQDASNNSLSEGRTTAADPTAANQLLATFCDNAPVTLRNLGTGSAFWYDAPTGGTLLASGNRAITNVRPAGDVFYVSMNDFSGTLGPVGKQVFGGGTYAGNFGPQPLIRAEVPLVLESARLYIGSAGRIAFTVRKPDDTPVSSVLLNVRPTRNPDTPQGSAPAGQLADDPNDPGQEYALNLTIPEPGDYKITIDYDGGASIFRSNVGVTGFPISLPGVLTLRGALFRQADGRLDTLTNAYYYLYNLKVRSAGCPAPQRIPVTAQRTQPVQVTLTPTGAVEICQDGAATLRTTEGSALTYQWFRNGESIANASASALAVTREGVYTVQVTGGCQPVTPDPVTVTVRQRQEPSVTRDGYVLTSNKSTGNQWLLNGVPISGATGQTLTATQSGRYAVRTVEGACGELISQEIMIDIVTSVAGPVPPGLQVSPNPAGESTRVSFETDTNRTGDYRLVLTDSRGRMLRRMTVKKTSTGKLTFDVPLTGLAAGLYIISIEDEQRRFIGHARLVKQ